MPSPLLTPTQHSEVQKLLAEKSLAHFMRQAWHVVEPSTPLMWGRHLDAICAHLEAVTAGAIRNLVITIPPGCTKSITCSVMWPAWTWAKQPGVRWLTAANGGDLVIRDAVACRRLIESEWYRQWWGNVFDLTTDQNIKSWYENTKRGFRTAISVSGAATGKKGDILLLDDPDDAKKVRSEAERRSVHEWWDMAFYNRVNNHKTGCRVVIGQRTHEEDLIGHILAAGGFEHLNIPEEFDQDRRTTTSIGWTDWRKERGDLLREERFGRAEIDQAKLRLGSSGYAAQHNQNPIRTEGNQFKAEWLQHYTRETDVWMFRRGLFRENQEPEGVQYNTPQLRDCFLTVDTAATVKKTQKSDPDYTVIAAWMRNPRGDLVWVGVERVRLEIPDIPARVAAAYVRYGADKAYIESDGTAIGALQLCLRHKLPGGSPMNVIPLPSRGKGDKLQRASSALAMAEAGRIWLPARASDPVWTDVEAELLRFTGDESSDKHDDCVDVLTMACRLVKDKEVTSGPFKTNSKPLSQGPLGGRMSSGGFR